MRGFKEHRKESYHLIPQKMIEVVKKNKNLDLYTTKNDKYFKQQFEIYC